MSLVTQIHDIASGVRVNHQAAYPLAPPSTRENQFFHAVTQLSSGTRDDQYYQAGPPPSAFGTCENQRHQAVPRSPSCTSEDGTKDMSIGLSTAGLLI
jgi:hypothetical protein